MLPGTSIRTARVSIGRKLHTTAHGPREGATVLSLAPYGALPTWRAFEFDDIAFRVRKINGRPCALRAIARDDRTDTDAQRPQMAANFGFVEWFQSKAEVIQVARLLSWRRATSSAKLAVHGNKIDDRPAGAQLDQANCVLSFLNRTAEPITIEAEHAIQIDNAQYQVIDFADVDHRPCETEAWHCGQTQPPGQVTPSFASADRTM